MSEAPVQADAEVQNVRPEPVARTPRLLALGLVLSISLLRFIVASFYYLSVGTLPRTPQQLHLSLISALLGEGTSLLLLWYVLHQQGRSWNDIGWKPSWWDVRRGIALLAVSMVVSATAAYGFQLLYRSYAGHYLESRSMRGILGFGISALSIAFVLLNPVFEEMIVRAYTMSEVMGVGGSRTIAVLVSVTLQMSYHLYQGLLSCIALAAVFTVFSIYFARTRRIAPIILAHFCFDAYALIRLSL